MAKKLWGYFKQFVALGLAVALAVYLAPHVQDAIARAAAALSATSGPPAQTIPQIDFKVLVPVLTPIIYLLGALIVACTAKIFPFIGKLADDKAAFAGNYLSLSRDPDSLGVIKINSSVLSGKYRLVGYTFSLHDERATGSWHSDSLDMITKEPCTLIYAYSGIEYDTRFEGRGYAKIGFGPSLLTGDGHWVDVPEDENKRLIRKNAKYVKLTGKVRRVIIDLISFDSHFPYILVRCFIRKPESIAKAFHKKNANNILPLFKRPT